jgi:PadR family transcriptional regulator, regulatory protein PadR
MADPLRLLKGTFDVLILKTLSWGPAHGYAISRWLRESSSNQLIIEEGALYPALRRLEEKGWIESEWRTAESGREARVYALTRPGRKALASEEGAWRRYMEVFSRVLAARPKEALS